MGGIMERFLMVQMARVVSIYQLMAVLPLV